MDLIQLSVMFLLALVVEVCGAGYTIAVSKGNMKWALIFSAAYAIVGAGVLFNVVKNPMTLPASVVGEIMGTFCTLTVVKRRGIKM